MIKFSHQDFHCWKTSKVIWGWLSKRQKQVEKRRRELLLKKRKRSTHVPYLLPKNTQHSKSNACKSWVDSNSMRKMLSRVTTFRPLKAHSQIRNKVVWPWNSLLSNWTLRKNQERKRLWSLSQRSMNKSASRATDHSCLKVWIQSRLLTSL